MKKIIKTMALIMSLLVVLVACESKGKETASKEIEGKKYKIGINQLMEHKALDDARQGFMDGLDEYGVDAEVEYDNAYGEIATATTIAEKLVGDKMDLIYSIATPAAQSTARATDSTPIIFTAVTNPVEAKLVKSMDKPGGNITGTCDAADVESQLKMFNELDPSIKTIGIIYNTSEANSEVQVSQVQEIAPKLGFEVETCGVNSINDVKQGLDNLMTKIDALYIISDNMIASSVELVRDTLIEHKMISVSAEESQVAGGILLTNGIKYYDLGKISARIAKEILVDGKNPGEIPVELSEKKTVVVNEEMLNTLGLDKSLPIFQNAEFVK